MWTAFSRGKPASRGKAAAYGYVRTARRIDDQVILTKFHEGIDIQPVSRDKAGDPLDIVSSIADGRVVHTSPIPGRSNYGRYVVVEHTWEDSQVYSLYAHLAEVTCKPGDAVEGRRRRSAAWATAAPASTAPAPTSIWNSR